VLCNTKRFIPSNQTGKAKCDNNQLTSLTNAVIATLSEGICLSDGLQLPETNKLTRAHQEMRYPNVTWCIILYDYLFTTELQQICSTLEYFWSNAYISNGCRFTKSALRIWLLSTFRVPSINYSLVCSLPIHTRSPSNDFIRLHGLQLLGRVLRP